MNPQRYEQVYDLFTRLREQPPEARRSILDQACADDAEMRREVEAMLSADAHPLRLESWPGIDIREGLQDETETELAAASPLERPKSVGHYSIRRVIATGGMGVVYEAVQEHPHRTVALKVLRGGIASRSALRRFEHESQILARLRHPNIAQVYEAGMHDDGTRTVPFFAMEYIPNARTLSQCAREEKLDHRQRLQLFAKVCDAVHHGHQKGIIHRDLKPANILVDSAREPKIIDFGVARATDSDMAVTTLQTDVGQLIGTLQYMSPEQCAADPHDLDSRSDVYALGVVLYELICEQLPYDISEVPIPEAVRIIREESPTRPSTIERRLRGDTETIVLKALAKERDRRYRSAAELADDIKRYLNDEPILARPPSTFYQFRKFATRNKVLVSSMTAILIVLVAAVAVSTTYAISEARAHEEAEQARTAEQEQRKLAEQREKDATEAREQAQQRADQLETVTKFQASTLSEMDAEQMGHAILADQRERVREGLEADEASPERIEAVIASFDELAALVNTTDLALKVVDEQVLSRAVQTIEQEFADQPLVEAALRDTIGTTYQGLGLYPQAMPQIERALTLRRRELGDDHPDTLSSVNNMGLLLQAMGKLAEAEPYYHEALEDRRRVLGNDHPDTLTSINNMGFLLESMGKLAQAEPYFREALEGRHRVLGDDHPATLTSINNMGFLLQSMGKLAEAEPYYREVVEASRRVLGVDHPNTLSSINNLGYLLNRMGKLEEAEPYYREALEGHRRVLGDDHPDTLRAISSMAYLFHSMGKLEETIPYVREVLEGSRRALGDDHPNTLTAINNMGFLLRSMGKLTEAEPYLRDALEGFRRMLGDDHPDTLTAINNMGLLLSDMGKLTDAEAHYREALESRRRILGDAHPDTLESIINMGSLLRSIGKLAEAEAYNREAVEASRRVLGDDHPNTLQSIHNLGFLLEKMGKLAEAEPYYREALEGQRRVLGDDHPNTLISIHNMGRLLRGLGRLEEAETLGAEAVRGARAKLPSSHPLRFPALVQHGRTLAAMQRFAEAEAQLLEAHQGFVQTRGRDDKRTKEAAEVLVDLYDAWDKPDQAARYRELLPPASEPADANADSNGV